MPEKPPIEAEKLIPHRPPMLLVKRLLERDPLQDTALAEADAPAEGLFINQDHSLVPEYYIELSAQAAGLANGYDRLRTGDAGLQGFLTGLDRLRWLREGAPGTKLLVRLRKEFEFGNIKMIAASVYNRHDLPIFEGIIKVWEENV